ncbi:MAG: AMP-binding protein [Burkholderiales bacterium]
MDHNDNVYEAFQHTARAHPAATFLHIPASALPGATQAFEITYAAALAQVDALGADYRKAGYGVGHRVALLLANRPAFLFHYLALNGLGVSAVPLNPDYRENELEYVLDHSEACLVVTLPDFASKLRSIGGARPVVIDGERVPAPANRAASQVAARGDECALLYTSGTTGKPKGCLLTNDYTLTCGDYYNAEGGVCAIHPGTDRLITPLPLFHMNALLTSTTAMILAAGCVIQIDRFHPKTWWSDVKSSGATIVHYLGVMPAILLAQPPSTEERAHQVRFGFGANANPKDHAAFEARFGFPLIEAWAMTETGAGAWITSSREPRHVGTRCIGRPGPHLEWRLVDEHGQDVALGEPGELLIRRKGPAPRRAFFSGYLKDPAATAAAWQDGWFHTGDAMRVGNDGLFHFVDRRKNIIRRSGENIAALEVEAALADHPAVKGIAVIAVPDPVRDEEVMACVVAADGAARNADTAAAIQDLALSRLAYFKAPGYVLFIDSLPTTATNKVQKAKLADFGVQLGEGGALPAGCFDLRDRKKRTTPN